eukprot:2461299-Pyramimonas_sp.AAC.1
MCVDGFSPVAQCIHGELPTVVRSGRRRFDGNVFSPFVDRASAAAGVDRPLALGRSAGRAVAISAEWLRWLSRRVTEGL